MATHYQVQVQLIDGSWKDALSPQDSATAAEILCLSGTFVGSHTRVVPVEVEDDWVPNKIPPAERAAEIVHIKALAEDLASDKANYAATLESIVVRARRLFDDEARLIGRGYKDGENQACQSCDGVYVKTLDRK